MFHYSSLNYQHTVRSQIKLVKMLYWHYPILIIEAFNSFNEQRSSTLRHEQSKDFN